MQSAIRNPPNPQSAFHPMLLGEPPPTQADLHFRLFGIPGAGASVLLGRRRCCLGWAARTSRSGRRRWFGWPWCSFRFWSMNWATRSMQRFYGGHPWITLYGFGGLASCNDCDRSPRRQILISAGRAGRRVSCWPASLSRSCLSGHSIGFARCRLVDRFVGSPIRSGPSLLGPFVAYFEPFARPT